MKAFLPCLFALMLPLSVTAEDPDDGTVIALAMGTLDRFMLAFNKRDMDDWADTLHFPHVRFASGTVTVYRNKKEFTKRPVFKTLASQGWDHSHWLSRDVVMSSPDKVHISTRFQRYNESNEPIGTYESLYIVTRIDGRWGIQARSSLAP